MPEAPRRADVPPWPSLEVDCGRLVGAVTTVATEETRR